MTSNNTENSKKNKCLGVHTGEKNCRCQICKPSQTESVMGIPITEESSSRREEELLKNWEEIERLFVAMCGWSDIHINERGKRDILFFFKQIIKKTMIFNCGKDLKTFDHFIKEAHAKIFGVSQSTISLIINKKRWKHI